MLGTPHKKIVNFCEAASVKIVRPRVDSRIRWDSTCALIEVTMKLKPALEMLCDYCPGLSKFKLHASDWKAIGTILNCLQYFKQANQMISGQNKATLPAAVLAFNMLPDKVEALVKSLDNKIDRNINDETILLAFQAQKKKKKKLLKRWLKCNWIYVVSLVLDPRHKVYDSIKSKWGEALKK